MASRKKPVGLPDYDVGYGKPPKQHQFEKDKTNNPWGRAGKGGSKNLPPNDLGKLLQEALHEHVWVTVENKKTRMSKGEVMIKRMVGDAMKGDPKARSQILEFKRMFPNLELMRPVSKLEMIIVEPAKIRGRRIWEEIRADHPDIPEADLVILRRYFPAVDDDTID